MKALNRPQGRERKQKWLPGWTAVLLLTGSNAVPPASLSKVENKHYEKAERRLFRV